MGDFLAGLALDFLAQLQNAEVIWFAFLGTAALSSEERWQRAGFVTLAWRFLACLLTSAVVNVVIDRLVVNFILQLVVSGALFCGIVRDFALPRRTVLASILVASWTYSGSLIFLLMLTNLGTYITFVRAAYLVAVLGFVWWVDRHIAGPEVETPPAFAALMLAVCLSGLVAEFVLQVGFYGFSIEYSTENFLICMGAQAACLVAYAMFARTVRAQSDALRAQAEQAAAEKQVEALKAFRLSEQSLRELRHEVKNQYAYIATLLDQHDYEAAEAFFGEMQMRAAPTLSRVNSGNAQVDDIVNLEIAKALEAGLTVDARIAVPPQLPYDDLDLCSLISNLLDNAIEACVRAGGGCVTFSMTADVGQGALLVVAKNPCAEEPHRDARGRLISSKAEEGHGCGTGVVCRIAQSYGGVADFSWADGTFTARVLLDLPAQEGERAHAQVPRCRLRRRALCRRRHSGGRRPGAGAAGRARRTRGVPQRLRVGAARGGGLL